MNGPASDPLTVKVPMPVAAVDRDGFAIIVPVGRERGVRAVLECGEPLTLLIGRAPECAIRLRDEQVSRRHAQLEWNGEMLRIVDLGSANGTLVNDERVASTRLRGGESILVGGTLLHVVAITAGSSSARPRVDC